MIIIINIIIIIIYNTPGTAGGRDRTLAVKIPKRQKNLFCMYLLVMPKYWVIPQSGSKAENGEEKKLIFFAFFEFLRPAFGHGRLGHPQSLEYYKLYL